MRVARLIAWAALAAALWMLATPAHAAPVITYLIVEGIASAVVLSGLAKAVLSFAISALLSNVFGKSGSATQDNSANGFQSEAQGRLQVVRSAIATRRTIYGTVMVSGPLVYAEVAGPGNGDLHMIVALAGHEIEAIDEVYFNDEKVGDLDSLGVVISGRFAGAAIVRKYLGSPTQTAEPRLVAESAGKWTAAHRLQGIAYVYIRLTWHVDIYQSGIPNIKCLVRGKKVYDPRDSVTRYSNNWALVLRDYLRTAAIDGGLGADADEVDDTDFITTANLCDERVLAASHTQTFTALELTTSYSERCDIDGTNQLCRTATATGRATGDPVTLTTTNVLCWPLVEDTTYYWIAVSSTTGKLALTMADALGNVPIVLGGPDNVGDATVHWNITAIAGDGRISLAVADSLIYTGDGVTVSSTGTLPAPLAAATTYYAIRRAPTLYQLASSVANAKAGVAIALTTYGSGTHTVAHVDQVRYTCDGTVDTGRKPKDILPALLTGAAGILTYPQGQFKVRPAAYDTPTVTLTESDLRGPLQLSPRIARRELFNAVRGTYSNPANAWQPSDFPVVVNATYEAQDGGERIVRDIELAYTTDSVRAQRIAKIHLEKSRQGMVLAWPGKFTCFRLGLWDTVLVTVAQLGFSAKVFRVTGWTLAADAQGVDLVLREDSAASYNWAAGEATLIDPAPDTILPSAFTVGAPGAPVVVEELYETSGSAGAKSRAVVTWGASADAFVAAYEPQYKDAADAAWLTLPNGSGRTTTVSDLAPGLYDFRVRATNAIGARSAWSPTTTKEILGLTAPPADVSGFSVSKSAGFALAAWSAHPDLDVRLGGAIVIRYSSLTSGATWSDSVVYDEFPGAAVQGLVPLRTGTYMAKARDSSGFYSQNAVSFNATEGLVTGFTTVATVTEHPTFTGAKTNIVLISSAIQLDSSVLWDSVAGNIDTWTDIDGQGTLAATGEYLFASRMDAATVATRRVEFSISATAFDIGALIDARTDDIDGWDSIDSAIINDCDIQTWARFTDTDPAGSPTWGAWTPFYVADATFRGAEFKATFSSGDVNHNIKATALSVAAKIP